MRRLNKGGGIMHEGLLHIVLIALIFGLFLMANINKMDSEDIKQQVLEKQLALLIDSGEPGMEFVLNKFNQNGVINSIEVRDDRVFVTVSGYNSLRGYPIYTRYDVVVEDVEDKILVKIQ